MIYPSIEDLTKGEFNRYALCIACAKCARMVTDQYVVQRREAEELIARKETTKSLASMINKDIRDEKAVKNAIRLINQGDVKIVFPAQSTDGASAPAAQEETKQAQPQQA